MKKFVTILLLFIALGLPGCGGWGTYDAKVSATRPLSFNLSGGAASSTMHVFQVDVLTNTVNSLSVDAAFWNIVRNDGGSGTLSVAYTAIGIDCTTATPIETIPITARTISTGDTPVLPATLQAINNHLNGAYQVCLGINQTDILDPVDIGIAFPVTASAIVSGSLT